MFGPGRVFLDWSRAACYKTPTTIRPVKLLDVVALLDGKPAEGLACGQVGTVVDVLAPDAFEVEFLDANGRTIALGEFHRNELLLLGHDRRWRSNPRNRDFVLQGPRSRQSEYFLVLKHYT